MKQPRSTYSAVATTPVVSAGATLGPIPALRIQNVSFAYSRQRPRSGDMPWSIEIGNIALERGKQMLMTADSGGGKSTILHLIAGLIEPEKGVIEIGGTAINELRGADRDKFRGKNIGMIFQSFNLLPGFTALENVMAAMLMSGFPNYQFKPKAHALLDRLQIKHHAQKVETMSMGQQQRVAVARALVCDPILVIADEPTASLDPTNGNVCMDLIQNLCDEKGAALLCVSHDPGMAVRFDRRVKLEDLRPATPFAARARIA